MQICTKIRALSTLFVLLEGPLCDSKQNAPDVSISGIKE